MEEAFGAETEGSVRHRLCLIHAFGPPYHQVGPVLQVRAFSVLLDIGALILRIGFGAHYTKEPPK